jgi:hypothetical protein
MTTSRRLPLVTLSWQTWALVAAVLALVLLPLAFILARLWE